MNKIELKELFEIFYILENHVTFIYEKTLPKIFKSDDDESEEVDQKLLNFDFIKPLLSLRETILKEFIEKSEDRILEFKQCLIDEKIFEIPRIFKELKYIFNGLIGMIIIAGNSEKVKRYIKEIIRNFIIKIILNTEKENAEGFIMTISSKTICLIRDFYLAQRKVLDNKFMLTEEITLISDRIDFLEYCLKISTEREIWWKVGLNPTDHQFETAHDYVIALKGVFEKLRWVPLKLNSLLHFNDYDIKQLIAEEAKNNVIMRMNDILQELLEYCQDEFELQKQEGTGIELIESIRKKINA